MRERERVGGRGEYRREEESRRRRREAERYFIYFIASKFTYSL